MKNQTDYDDIIAARAAAYTAMRRKERRQALKWLAIFLVAIIAVPALVLIASAAIAAPAVAKEWDYACDAPVVYVGTLMNRLLIGAAMIAAFAVPAHAATEAPKHRVHARAAVVDPQPAQPVIGGYRIASPFERLQALCEATADGSGVGFVAFGRPAFVGGAVLGNVIGNAIRHARSYDQCMTMHGFVRAQQ